MGHRGRAGKRSILSIPATSLRGPILELGLAGPGRGRPSPGAPRDPDLSPGARADDGRLRCNLGRGAPVGEALHHRGALVPDSFEDYARILHPAYRPLGDGREEAVTWATVASWTGRVAHPVMQFERIADLGTDPNTQPEWGRRPEVGKTCEGSRSRS
jgi:hypothetical protein